MKKTLMIVIMAMGLLLPVPAQTVIEGVVLDAAGKAAAGYVTVTPKGSTTILGYTNLDGNGRYRLEFTSEADSVKVTASGLAIGREVRMAKNRSQTLDFKVRDRALQLKEVTVKADKIRQSGDTLNYLVGAYQQQGDRTIGDVLKRMPGIEVSESGGIKFNGKQISKFYVEDMDLLQGRYGLATNNINASDVSTVQIERNHQPIKALQGKTLTDDIAVNLKLKNSAKGTLAVNTLLGGGAQEGGGESIGDNPLWKAELVGMYFSGRRQNMTLYKGGDTGEDFSSELTSHYGSTSLLLYPFCPVRAIMPSGSGLPQRRTFDNRSHVFSTNHLEKPGKDTEIGLNIAYYNDRVRREETSTSTLFISDDSRLVTDETMTSETKTDNLSFSARYCRNAPNGFLANVLSFDGKWNTDEVGSVLSSGRTGTDAETYGDERVRQRFRRPEYSVSNTVNLVRNFGKKTLDLHLSLGYGQIPGTLSVGVDSLLQGTQAAYGQDITSHHVAGDFHTKYDYRTGAFTLQYRLMANASLHGVKTDLEGFQAPADTDIDSPTQNDLWYNTYEVTLGQQYKLTLSPWRLTLDCPLTLYSQTLDDRLRDERNSYTHFLVTPLFSVDYELMDWGGSASVWYAKTVGDPGGIYNGFIMNNYRSFQRSYVDQLSETDRIGASAKISYSNALSALFFHVNAGYTRTKDNQTYGYSYQGSTSVVQAIDQGTTTDSYSIGANVSKGFEWLQCTVRAFGGYSRTEKELLVQQQLYPFHSQTISAGGGLTVTPLPWLNLVLTGGYNWSRSKTDNGQDARAQVIRSTTQRVKLNAYLTKKLTLTATAEDNYNNLTETDRHCWFGDLQAEYKLKRVDLGLQLNNVFNQRQYTRVSYSGLDIYSTTSQLRSRHFLATIRFKLL